uniref:Uncharacterized protein n=1 Tax=Arundo donax TaxID=35708 RepID=A0A0A8YQX8_ARUDO
MVCTQGVTKKASSSLLKACHQERSSLNPQSMPPGEEQP